MKKKIPPLKIIGYGLALLYAVSFATFLYFLDNPEFKSQIIFFTIIFGALIIGSLAVAMLQEWGRQVVIGMNVLLFVLLMGHFIPKIGVVPSSYIFMTIIVFLYFNQTKIRQQFFRRNIGFWRSILIIDDEDTTLKILRPLLMSYGYSVLTAKTGEVGLDVAGKQKPDLIILDVILPGIKGREVCKRLKSNPATEKIPVVFMTSKDSPDDIKAEMEVGAAAHLSKPVNAKALISTIRGVLDPKI